MCLDGASEPGSFRSSHQLDAFTFLDSGSFPRTALFETSDEASSQYSRLTAAFEYSEAKPTNNFSETPASGNVGKS